jgi:hypothetical protein
MPPTGYGKRSLIIPGHKSSLVIPIDQLYKKEKEVV